jgi:transcriptional regulator with XRE-family HTH domain
MCVLCLSDKWQFDQLAIFGKNSPLPDFSYGGEDASMEDNKSNLRDIRMSLGMKQTDVAGMLGHASPDRISHWEKGVAFPGIVNLFKLSLIYRVPPEQMYADFYKSLFDELQQKMAQNQSLGSNPFPVQNEVCETKTPE